MTTTYKRNNHIERGETKCEGGDSNEILSQDQDHTEMQITNKSRNIMLANVFAIVAVSFAIASTVLVSLWATGSTDSTYMSQPNWTSTPLGCTYNINTC